MTDDIERKDEMESAGGWTEAELDLTTLDDELLPPGHRSGFVAVVGRPNVGKSTLINAYLGQKVAIVSPKPQTTRLRQMGILTAPDYQIVFVDTPGWHQPRHRLGEFMVKTASQAISDSDVILFVVDISEPPTMEDGLLADVATEMQERVPVILALNKVDQVQPNRTRAKSKTFKRLVPAAEWVLISATRGDNRQELLEMIVGSLPEGPRYYPADQVTDIRVRDLAGELIREQALNLLHQEVPHSVAVVVEEFKERSKDLIYVSATVYVERESQKGILIGHKGTMLKRIGAAARREIEHVLEVRVYLDLWVKVHHKWRKKPQVLRQFGYNLPK